MLSENCTMSLPGNGIFVVQGEMAMLVTAMRRSTRWGSHSFPNEEYDVLMRTFQDLKAILNQVVDLRSLDPATYLSPFLEVIRSKETTGPVTSLALSAIHKFLSYGLIDPAHPSVPATVEDIADAVTHARFVGTDHSSDGVVLMKILQVLRTLMLSPVGEMLTDESVCEIMLSCFRICFETRLTELLRRNAEQCLRDMTQLIFTRLPQFSEPAGAAGPAPTCSAMGLSLKKRDKPPKRKNAPGNTNSLERKSPVEPSSQNLDNEDMDSKNTDALLGRHAQDKNLLNEAEITIEPVSKAGVKHLRHSSMDLANSSDISQLLHTCIQHSDDIEGEVEDQNRPNAAGDNETEIQPEDVAEDVKDPEVKYSEEQDIEDGTKSSKPAVTEDSEKLDEVYVNNRGIRFTPLDESANMQPYGLVCVRELFRFLISLCNPLDPQNTSGMVHLGLCLVGTTLEVAADQITKFRSLLDLVKDPLCRNLTCLLSTERISIFALDLQVSFLLFEAQRFHLKFQLEAYIKKIIEIISADTTKAAYELKEIHHLALEFLAQLFKIPGLCSELYINYDCDVYCINLFEELTKLLSKNVVAYTTDNSLSLEALMTIIEAIEIASNQGKECPHSEQDTAAVSEAVEHKYGRVGHVLLEMGGFEESGSEQASHQPSNEDLDHVRNIKKWVSQGTELFNQKPERGVGYLQQHGVLATPLDPHQLAIFLRENPALDKKMIGEYICKRSNIGEDEGPSVLVAFADSFDYAGLRIDQALRMYLETFRLPGEAPLIFLVIEKFAERWHSTNGEPFANTDAAFRLAYAVIMLNMDQHNHNAKKLNVPMTVEDFVKNLRGCNGSGDYPQPMLEAIFQAIKNEEIVMPAERVGPVRDAYLWRVLQRRGATPAGNYTAATPTSGHYSRLFTVACPPTVTALSAAFERAPPPSPLESDSVALYALDGLERCASLLARLPAERDRLSVDTLLLTLCKFTGLLSPVAPNYISIGVTLGQSTKAQSCLRRACAVAARHADCVRDSWRHILEIVRTLYIGRLLPKCLIEAEDYLSPSGTVSLVREAARGSDSGLLSSLYSYIALGESGIRTPSPHEKALIDSAVECVAKCNLPALLIHETKFLHLESLQELVRAMVAIGAPPDAESLQMNPQLEDVMIFFLELLGQTLIQNRDRALEVWESAGAHYRTVTVWSTSRATHTQAHTHTHALSRTLSALLRTSARLMRCEVCAPAVLSSLELLFELPYKLFYAQADVISCGLYEVVKTSAQNVHSAPQWELLFSLLTAAGAGAWPACGNVSPSSRSEGSEEEGDRRPTSVSSESDLSHSPQTQGWILVQSPLPGCSDAPPLRAHRPPALVRCCEALALVIRDVAHVTPYNCRAAVAAVRLFVRATLHGGKKPRERSNWESKSRSSSGRRSRADDSSDEEDDTLDQYHQVSIQLLDLMHTLHSRTAQIFRWWREEADQGSGAEDYDLWEVAWMPLLQGIAQFCTDRRKQVANSAIAYLQRALLAPGLSAMGGAGWEACFLYVLFPLLERLPRRADTAARANTIMCKVFLHHLSALSSRASFSATWLRVVSIQRALVLTSHEPLTEAALESLKNMILVMDSVKIFSNGEGYTELWYVTWEKIGEFLPSLKEELFPQAVDTTRSHPNLLSQSASLPSTIPTLVPVGASLANSTPTILPLVPNMAQITQAPGNTAPAVGNIVTSVGNVAQPVCTAEQAPNVAQSPVNLGQPSLISPVPISGMVPIRNPLYAQGGLTSSVLLQPLNEMISTPIGASMNSTIPILYPTSQPPNKNTPYTQAIESTTQQAVLDLEHNVIQTENEIYADYLNNPYNDKEVSTKEATLYDPEENRLQENVPNLNSLKNPALNLEKKSFSADASPLHDRNKAEFGSSDNIKAEQSGMFNFSSYFGMSGGLAPGSEVFDNLMSTDG